MIGDLSMFPMPPFLFELYNTIRFLYIRGFKMLKLSLVERKKLHLYHHWIPVKLGSTEMILYINSHIIKIVWAYQWWVWANGLTNYVWPILYRHLQKQNSLWLQNMSPISIYIIITIWVYELHMRQCYNMQWNNM